MSRLEEAHHETLGVRADAAHAGSPGRNLAILAEVAARNQLLRNGAERAAARRSPRRALGQARDGRSRIRR
jgi:hypothetical protein